MTPGMAIQRTNFQWPDCLAEKNTDVNNQALFSSDNLNHAELIKGIKVRFRKLSDKKLKAIRRSRQRGLPLGDEGWTIDAATRLGLQSTTRPGQPGEFFDARTLADCFSP